MSEISKEQPSDPSEMKNLEDPKADLKIIQTFFEKSANIFVILSIIGALISLLPTFLDIIIGKDWINILLGSQPGFYTLTLLLITSYTGALFMFLMFILIVRTFYHEVIKNKNCSKESKFSYILLMIIGGISIGSLILFLVFSWIIRIDYAIKFNVLIITLIVGYSFLIGLLSFVYISAYDKYPSYRLDTSILFVIIVGLFIFIVTPILIGTSNEVTNYYKDKEFGISLRSNVIEYSNDTPLIIALSYQLPVVPGNLTFFDVNYAQCHWSTNYGYFFTKNPKYSLMKKYDQEIIIPNCPYFEDNIYWTYEISDFSENKPPIFIGLTLEDTNNPKRKMGSANLSFNWSSKNILKNSTLWII